jgi:hypothetical protein
VPESSITQPVLKEIDMGKKLTEVAKRINAANATMKRNAKTMRNQVEQHVQVERFSFAIVQQLDVLTERRKQWEATDFKKANDGLYALLGDCLSIYKSQFVNGTDNEKKGLRKSLMERLTASGVRVVKSSTTLTMLARFVFCSDRKRAQGYGYVLAAAVSHDIDAEGFAAWVVEQGGIEEIKRKMVKKPEAIAKQQAVEAAKVAVKGELDLNALQPLAHVSIEGLTGSYVVLLAKPNASGGADVVGSLPDINDTLVNALILRMAKRQVETATADKELGRQIANESADLLAANDARHQKVANA